MCFREKASRTGPPEQPASFPTCSFTPHADTSRNFHVHATTGRALAFAALLLLFIINNLGTVFLRLRGMPPEQFGMAILCYEAGIMGAALGLDVLMRIGRGPAGLRSVIRAGLAALLALPGLFCLIYFRFMPFSGTSLANGLLFCLWGTALAITLRFFFRHTPPDRQALYLGIAMGAGHLCWSLVMPMAEGLYSDSPFASMGKERFLNFLNLARGLIGIGAAVLVWKLSGMNAAQEDWVPEHNNGTAQTGSGVDRRVAFLLPSLILCYTLNGIMGYILLSRHLPQGVNMEYAHLAMTLLLPLAGLAVFRHGVDSLRFFLAGATCCFVLSPCALLSSVPAELARIAYVACVMGQQVLLFAAVLALARFLPQTRRPALLLCLPWMAYLFSVAGNSAARQLPVLGLSSSGAACVLALLCAASIPLLRRAFPLPEPPSLPVPSVSSEDSDERAKFEAFVAAFVLSGREAEVLDAIIRQLPIERICAEMGISERTVRFHQTGLFKKTATLNRRRLALFYSAWKPE